jgi:hypothetical protein
VKIVAFVIALALFVVGLLLFGYAFEPNSAHGIMFFGGVIAIAVSLAIPFHALKRVDN